MRLLMPLAMFLLSLNSILECYRRGKYFAMCFDCFTRKGCPQLINRLKWPVAKQWEQTFVKGIDSDKY